MLIIIRHLTDLESDLCKVESDWKLSVECSDIFAFRLQKFES